MLAVRKRGGVRFNDWMRRSSTELRNREIDNQNQVCATLMETIKISLHFSAFYVDYLYDKKKE